MKKIKIALLSTQKSEILGHIINKFIEYDIKIDSIIFDSKLPGDKHFQIWDKRTNGNIPFIPMANFEKLFIPYYHFENHIPRHVLYLSPSHPNHQKC